MNPSGVMPVARSRSMPGNETIAGLAPDDIAILS